MSGNTTPFWNLRPDEAVVFVGRTPPECRYFSYDHYIMHRTIGNERRWLFANIADTVNNLVIKTEGTQKGKPFNQTTVIIITADKGIDQRIRDAAQSAGYSDNIINTQVLPSSILNMGRRMIPIHLPHLSAQPYSMIHRLVRITSIIHLRLFSGLLPKNYGT